VETPEFTEDQMKYIGHLVGRVCQVARSYSEEAMPASQVFAAAYDMINNEDSANAQLEDIKDLLKVLPGK